MKEMFYCNHRCILVADLGDDAVIDIVVGAAHFGGYDEPPYTETDERRIIVPKRLLTENQVDLEGQFIEAAKRIRDLEAEARSRTVKKTIEAEAYIKDLKAKVAGYAGLEQMMDFLDGKIKWAVKKEYYTGLKILNLSEVKCDAHERGPELAAVSFRRNNYGKTGVVHEPIKMFLSNYSDDSGNGRHEIIGFETEALAITYVLEKLSQTKWEDIKSSDIETCLKYNLTIPAVEKAIAEQEKRSQERKKEERTRLEQELKRLI